MLTVGCCWLALSPPGLYLQPTSPPSAAHLAVDLAQLPGESRVGPVYELMSDFLEACLLEGCSVGREEDLPSDLLAGWLLECLTRLPVPLLGRDPATAQELGTAAVSVDLRTRTYVLRSLIQSKLSIPRAERDLLHSVLACFAPVHRTADDLAREALISRLATALLVPGSRAALQDPAAQGRPELLQAVRCVEALLQGHSQILSALPLHLPLPLPASSSSAATDSPVAGLRLGSTPLLPSAASMRPQPGPTQQHPQVPPQAALPPTAAAYYRASAQQPPRPPLRWVASRSLIRGPGRRPNCSRVGCQETRAAATTSTVPGATGFQGPAGGTGG